jgi:hypothetical protein
LSVFGYVYSGTAVCAVAVATRKSATTVATVVVNQRLVLRAENRLIRIEIPPQKFNVLVSPIMG